MLPRAATPTRSVSPDEYKAFVRAHFPRPTEEQIAAFSKMLTTDHSWYKHLSRRAPSVFLIALSGHMSTWREVMYCFKDTELPRFLALYRSKFGFLTYCYMGADTSRGMQTGSAPEDPDLLQVPDQYTARVQVSYYDMCAPDGNACEQFEAAATRLVRSLYEE